MQCQKYVRTQHHQLNSQTNVRFRFLTKFQWRRSLPNTACLLSTWWQTDRQTDRQVCLPLATGTDNDESTMWQVMSRFGRLLALSRKHYRNAAPLRLSYDHCHSSTSDCYHNDHVSFCVCHYRVFCEVQTAFSGCVSDVPTSYFVLLLRWCCRLRATVAILDRDNVSRCHV